MDCRIQLKPQKYLQSHMYYINAHTLEIDVELNLTATMCQTPIKSVYNVRLNGYIYRLRLSPFPLKFHMNAL